MSALIITALAFIPVLLIGLSVLRSTVLSKFLDDPDVKRRSR
jgi:hypothetical protein